MISLRLNITEIKFQVVVTRKNSYKITESLWHQKGKANSHLIIPKKNWQKSSTISLFKKSPKYVVTLNPSLLSFSLMQPSMGTLNSPSSRVVKDSTPSRRRILKYINFGIGESSPILFLEMVNLNLITFEARWTNVPFIVLVFSLF